LGSTFLLDSKAHAKIVVTLVKHTTKKLVAENDNYALAAKTVEALSLLIKLHHYLQQHGRYD